MTTRSGSEVVGLSLSWRTVDGGVGIVGGEGQSCSVIAHSDVEKRLMDDSRGHMVARRAWRR
jgi:hypothetical protein